MRRGSWWVRSKSDPRWNGGGRGTVGGFMKPPGVDKHIKNKRRELKAEPPDDCEWGYMKD